MRRSRLQGYCQRTARRVPLESLIEDGELPGLLVTRYDADDEHPQKVLKPLGPDYVIHRPAPPYASIGTTIRQGQLGNPATGQALINPVITTAGSGAVVITTDDAGQGYGVDGYGTGPWSL